MAYFSVDVPDGVREFLGFCARTNTLGVNEVLSPDMFAVVAQSWEQWADGQDEDLYNDGSFQCSGVTVETDSPFFVLGMRHAVWNGYCDTAVDLVAQATACNEMDVLEKAVWENITWEYAEQYFIRKDDYAILTVEGSALHALIHSIPRLTLNNILFRCQTHPIYASNVYAWLEEQHALRERTTLEDSLENSNKATVSKKM